MINFKLNNSVRYGVDALGAVAKKVREFGFKRVGIVVDGNLMEGSKVVAHFVAAMQAGFSCIIHICDEPTYSVFGANAMAF